MLNGNPATHAQASPLIEATRVLRSSKRQIARSMSLHGVIQLLDSAHGRPLQEWKIRSDDRVTIGRAPSNEIVVADPYVSRAHAYLDFDAERNHWCITTISHLKIVYDGRTLEQVDLNDGIIFRLGPRGCSMRFQQSTAEDAVDIRQTTVGDFIRPVLLLDQNQLQAAVSEITEGEFFQQLQRTAARLRDRATSSADERRPNA